MVKQNVVLQNADGTFRCALAQAEINRLLETKQIRRIVEKGKPVRYRMLTFPLPSNSRESAAQITAAEMRILPTFSDRELKRLAKACGEPVKEPAVVAKIKLIQRWMGHGLIGSTATTELIADATVCA